MSERASERVGFTHMDVAMGVRSYCLLKHSFTCRYDAEMIWWYCTGAWLPLLTLTMASFVWAMSDITPSVMISNTKYWEPSWTAVAYLDREMFT